ncbi:hypothetical protein [Brachybacterium hainanense]|uniref:Uncharacterized protein n=1 Tax=Brachybacterium hainanense TaxID=1541174 RepID=A0ABV6RE36_9MICO
MTTHPAALAARPAAVRTGRIAALAIGYGALSLVDPRELGPWARSAHRTARATITAVLVADTPGERLVGSIQDGVVAGSLEMGFSELTEHLDARGVAWLGRRGVPRPRVLLAGLSALSVGAAYVLPALLERVAERAEERAQERDGELEDAPSVSLDEATAALVERLLQAAGPQAAGADALRGQLAAARREDLPELTDVVFEVTEPAARAVPHTQVWPVQGAFAHEGLRFLLQLHIDGGVLEALTVVPDVEDPDDQDEAYALLVEGFPLPRADELELIAETA